MTQNPLQNSRMFDPYRWSTAPQVKAACAELQRTLKLNDKRYTSYVMMVLLDLYCSWRSDPSQYVSCSRDKNRYGKNSRYKKIKVGFRGIVTLMNKLFEEKFIEYVEGSCYRDMVTGKPYAGYTSRMRATSKLVRVIVRNKVKLSMISRHPNEEVIFQRSEKVDGVSEDIAYDKLPSKIEKSRKVLIAYNELLQKSYIDLDDKLATIDELKEANVKEYTIDLSRKRVYRVFNDGRWDHGGRIYGAWWHGCPKVLRKYILINNEPTIELDFSAIHILLLYAKLGYNYLEEGEDAYAIEGHDCRDIIKIVCQSGINAKPTEKGDGRSRAIMATWDTLIKKYNQSRKDAGINTHAQLYDIFDALKEKHQPIANYLASGEGVKLQLQDSEMAIELIKQHTEWRVPILTVHDSFIVPISFKEFTLDLMMQAYGKLVSKYLGVGYNSTAETIDVINNKIITEDTSQNLNLYKLIKPAFNEATIEGTITKLNKRVTSAQIRRSFKWNKYKHQYYKLNRIIT